MKNKKLLATLASTAGLAAAIAPAVCLTSCGQKSHFRTTMLKFKDDNKTMLWNFECQIPEGGVLKCETGSVVLIVDGKFVSLPPTAVEVELPTTSDPKGSMTIDTGTVKDKITHYVVHAYFFLTVSAAEAWWEQVTLDYTLDPST